MLKYCVEVMECLLPIAKKKKVLIDDASQGNVYLPPRKRSQHPGLRLIRTKVWMRERNRCSR